MNLQQHERIEQIKKLSGYMHIALRWAWYFLWVAWPIAVLVILLGRDVYLNLGSTSFHASEGTYLQRVLAAGLVSVGFFFLIFLTRHFRELMGYFHKGEIFNKAAIAHARKALLYALISWCGSLILEIVFWLYKVLVTQPMLKLSGAGVELKFNYTINGEIFIGVICFGLMYLLLWALEIGHDLNEESELTV